MQQKQVPPKVADTSAEKERILQSAIYHDNILYEVLDNDMLMVKINIVERMEKIEKKQGNMCIDTAFYLSLCDGRYKITTTK